MPCCLRPAELHFLAKRTNRADRLQRGFCRRGAVAAGGRETGCEAPSTKQSVEFTYRL